MQISPRWARNLSPEQQQSKKAVPQQVRICLTWSSQRFSNDDGETFHASWVFLPVEYEKANRKSTETDLYRNSFGAAKARHFIFAYTNKIQSVNRHFELPSETNTFSLIRDRAGFAATMLFTMQNENRAWHQYCFACKFQDYLFTTGKLTKSRQKQTNKQTKSLRSCSPFLKKSGERKKEDWKHDTSCWPFCFRNLLRKWSLLKIALTKREWNKKPVSAKPCTSLNMYTSNLVSRVEFPCIKILELTSWTRSYFSSDMVFVSLQAR